MANIAGFNAATKEGMKSFEAFPAHKATFMFTASEMKPTKKPGGTFLELKGEILDGQHKGRNYWVRLNLVNSNKQAVDIAERELGDICKAIGIMTPSDSAELHNKPIMVDFGWKKPKDSDPENYVKSYAPIGAGAAQAAQPPVQQQQAAAAPAAAQPTPPPATPPWQK